ncbi:MAG: hypothetical protein HKM26_08160 [Winogradskyella sp.]|nr:hypothetical protein [Winogradskyella sp.]
MKNKPTFKFFIFLTSILFLFLAQNNVNAQENEIYEVSDYSLKKKISKKNDKARFYDLALKKHPTLYINNGGLKSNSESIKPLKIDLLGYKSFNGFINGNYDKENVELIILTLDNRADLNNSLDVSNNNDFKKLKYILVKCNFNCTNEDILKFVKVNSKVRVFYKYDLPQ